MEVETRFENTSDKPVRVELSDAMRADNSFEMDIDADPNLFWAFDEWWRQAYGIMADGYTIQSIGPSVQRRRPFLQYVPVDGSNEMAPGKSLVLRRRIFPADSLLALRGIADGLSAESVDLQIRDAKGPVKGAQVELTRKDGIRREVRTDDQGRAKTDLPPGEYKVRIKAPAETDLPPGKSTVQIKPRAADQIAKLPVRPFTLWVRDGAGPVANARVELTTDGSIRGWGRTDELGRLQFGLPAGEFDVRVAALGRPVKMQKIDSDDAKEKTIELEQPGYVVSRLVDGDEKPVACKVEFRGRNETTSPNFGPASYEHGVRNLHYTQDGLMRQEIGPGEYDVIISHGPEYDAVFTQIKVERGKETKLEAKLVRTVDTTGWISADFHSHSSPSGDNTSSQRGRVLNLLAEHIEFAPCTEHNRISSYVPHLKALGVVGQMATCSGMELTGSPLPVNHQNAFPLVHRPHTQDGGGPTTDSNPIAQIERLVMWDEASDKLVQQNHPAILQIIGDRDADGKPDGGLERQFGMMDVIEVHPPGDIFSAPKQAPRGGRDRGNTIFHWMQLLNLGYRIPGVVNTDAHYNFHGSGWLRNYIMCLADDPARVKTLDIVHAAEHGMITMTNGPFLVVFAKNVSGNLGTAHPGQEIEANESQVRLRVRVQCANWLDVNRVQVFVNGRPDPKLNFTRTKNADMFGRDVLKFDESLVIKLEKDAHLIVAVAGEGLKLGAVMGPDAGEAMPVAVANPIFVDVDGDGFEPNRDNLGLPLPIAAEHRPSPSHKHRNRDWRLD